MAFLRFVVTAPHRATGVAAGLFTVAYAVRDSDAVAADHRRALRDLLSWFDRQLSQPRRFNRTTSKGYYRRATKGIAWFRDSAAEHLARMRAIAEIVEANGYAVRVIRADRVGYVVYEDEVQVIAEPFADTRTDP